MGQLGTQPRGFLPRVNHWQRMFGVSPAFLADESTIPYGRLQLILSGSNDCTQDELELLARALWGIAENFLDSLVYEYDNPPAEQTEFIPFTFKTRKRVNEDEPQVPRVPKEPKVPKPPMDLTGQQFGTLTVLERLSPTHWGVRCRCGQMKSVLQNNLRRGLTRSCGSHACSRFGKKDTSSVAAA